MKLANVIAMIVTGQILLGGVTPSVVAAAEQKRRVPFVYGTDLFHPHDDPDDHFDLATVFAMPELDVKAILLDLGAKQKNKPLLFNKTQYLHGPQHHFQQMNLGIIQ